MEAGDKGSTNLGRDAPSDGACIRAAARRARVAARRAQSSLAKVTEWALSEVEQGERGIQVQKHRLCTNEQEMVDRGVEACRKVLPKRE